MTTKTVTHTPGKWTIGDELEGDIFACGELLASAYPMKRDGLHDSWRANARLIAAAPQLLEALEQIECPECGHEMKHHADKYGCEVDRGDGHRIGSEILEALGPCGCECTDVPDLLKVIAAIRSAKGETL